MSSSANETAPRVALVTGSARGIGFAIAERLASDGYSVCLNCSSEASLPALQKQAELLTETYGVACAACAADVSDSNQARDLIAFTQETLGGLYVLVNNAGITRDGLLARMSDDDFDRVLAVNLKGTFHCCRAAASHFMRQRAGRIINISSVVGVRGNAGQANYAASKAGIIGLTQSIARELARRGVTANAIAPGFIDTDMTAALSDAQRSVIEERIAMGRMGRAEEVAGLVSYLAKDEAGYVTGQVISIDGGIVL